MGVGSTRGASTPVRTTRPDTPPPDPALPPRPGPARVRPGTGSPRRSVNGAGPYVPPSSAASAGVQACRTAVLPLAAEPAESEQFQADKRARLRRQREQMINGF